MNTIGQIGDRSAIILFGTETGNAKEFGEDTGRTLQRLHFATTVAELDSVSPVRQLIGQYLDDH